MRVFVLLVLGVVLLMGCGTGSEPDSGSEQGEEQAVVPAPAEPPREGEVLSFDGVPIAFSSFGEGEPTLVLIHGWLCHRGFWARQAKELMEHYRLVGLDLAGHGKSGHEREGWPLSAYGEDVKAVVEELGLERVVLVGHSMGGMVALEAARLMPERVVGVIGVDTFHNAATQVDPEVWERRMQRFEKDFKGSCEESVRKFFSETADPSLVRKATSSMCRSSPEMAISLLRQHGAYDLAAALRRVEVPVRTINSDMYPTDVQGNREFSPGFDMTLMEGAGHFPMMERPEEFNRLLVDAVGLVTGAAPSASGR